MKKAVTIKDIAQDLNLSRNTVSKALNGQYVPQKTRELVLRKARELNYKSLSSGALNSRKYRILLLSGKPFHNMSFFLPIVKGIEDYCFDNNFDFFQYTCKYGANTFWNIANHIQSLNIDGIVAIECFDPVFINNLLGLKKPICFIDFPGYKFDPVGQYDLVCAADQKIVCEYVKTLIAKYKIHRFAFVGDYRHCLSFHERYMGMLRGLSRSGFDHSQERDILERDEDFDYGDVQALKAKISALKRLPDCFVCCNDFVAHRVTLAIKELGHRIPQDTMILGFDGVDESLKASPSISTFYVNKESLGIVAIQSLINRIEYHGNPTRTIILDCDLIERESTKR